MQMLFIFETFKVHKNIEDNPEEIGDRLVNVKDLVSTRLSRKSKRIDDLIAIQQQKDQMQEDIKMQGLKQVDDTYMAPIMQKNTNLMQKVWRSIKDIDDEKNGFLAVNELEDCFREHFAPELEGKSLVYFFRRWSTDHDKDLVNYRRIKETILQKIYEFKTPVKD